MANAVRSDAGAGAPPRSPRHPSKVVALGGVAATIFQRKLASCHPSKTGEYLLAAVNPATAFVSGLLLLVFRARGEPIRADGEERHLARKERCGDPRRH